MRATIPSDQSCRIAAKTHGLAQQRLDPSSTAGGLRGQLTFGQLAQKTAAGLMPGSRLNIDALQKIVG